MKSTFRNLSLYFLLFFCGIVMAQSEIKFDESGLKAVQQTAKTKHKPVFYMIYASWCTHCNKMKQDVFKNPAVADFMNANFICAWQDAEKGEGDYFRQKFGIRSYPAFLIYDENGTIIYRFGGEYKSDTFLAEVKNALVPEKQLPHLQKEFYADPSNSKKALDFITTAKKGAERSEINVHAQKYLATQTDAQLVSETNWRIIANGVSDIQSHPFQYVLNHQKEFAAVASAKRVSKKIINIVNEMFDPMIETTDTTNYYKKRKIVEAIKQPKTDSLLFRYDLKMAEKAGDWKFYEKVTMDSAAKYVWDDAQALNEFGHIYLLYVKDIPGLKFGVSMVQRSLEKNETYEGALLAAKLSIKANDTKTAIAFAERARNRNASLGFSTKEADDMLLKLKS